MACSKCTASTRARCARRARPSSSASASAEEQRLKPRILSEQTITGIDGHHAALINRMRHGDMITEGQTLYTLEVHPAAYAAIAANEAEKAAPIHLLEVITFGAVGRLWLGGYEAEIAEAARAIQETLAPSTAARTRVSLEACAHALLWDGDERRKSLAYPCGSRPRSSSPRGTSTRSSTPSTSPKAA